MNEKIKQLAEQATTYIEPTLTSGEGWIFDKEKFAELIVKECVGLLGPAHSIMADPIKKHFGVEE
jgi:hypothetical protein